MYSSVSISCKIKDNYAINHRPRETRQQGVFMGHTQISKGKRNRKDFVSGLRADRDGNMSIRLMGKKGRVLRRTCGWGILLGREEACLRGISQWFMAWATA